MNKNHNLHTKSCNTQDTLKQKILNSIYLYIKIVENFNVITPWTMHDLTIKLNKNIYFNNIF